MRDTGVGMADPEGIFQAFRQLEPGRSGVGLGLAISNRLVEAMGGHLSVESSLGQGTTFAFTLPLESVAKGPSGRLPGPLLAASILVVEDNPVNRAVACKLLKRMGHHVASVEGGEAALALLAERDFDAILMDCRMPGMDGFETTRALRLLSEVHTPVIALTANATADDRARCMAAGMDDFLPKPVRPEALERVLGRHLPGSEEGADPD